MKNKKPLPGYEEFEFDIPDEFSKGNILPYALARELVIGRQELVYLRRREKELLAIISDLKRKVHDIP